MRLHSVLLAAGALVLAPFAWRDAAANLWLSHRVSAASGFLQGDPRVALAAVDRAVVPPNKADAKTAEDIAAKAQASLRAAPLEPAALRDFALALESLGRADPERTLLLSERISRRDRVGQNALLRIAATRGDYARTLAHLDKLLTVSPRSGLVFVPGIVALSADPELGTLISSYSGRPWFAIFAKEAIRTSPDPDTIAAILRKSHKLPREDRSDLLPLMLQRLVDRGRHGAARAFAIEFGGASAATLDDFGVKARTVDPALGPFAWQLTSDGVVQTELASDGALHVELAPSAVTPIMTRVTLLPPGRYVLDQKLAGGDSSSSILVQWHMRCSSQSGQPVVARGQSEPRIDGRILRSAVDIPPGCDAQTWTWKALADESQVSAGFELSRLSLRPAR